MTIYVGNLSFDAEVEDLQHLFSEYGSVVEMANPGEETKAIDDLRDVEWMGRMIRVNLAEPRSGGGAGAGRGQRW
jgi:RNA recognition motif-containing protein